MKNANPVSRLAALGAALALALAACGQRAPDSAASVPPLPPPAADGTPAQYTYEVVRSFPHDRGAFTQGLLFRHGSLLESTGNYGVSTLREVEPATGRVLKQVAVPREYFAEGLAVIGDRAFQLTWQHQKGFVYDADTFRKLQEFSYTGEGWGLTTDGTVLVLSDGTSRIRFLDPQDFHVRRTIDVTEAGRPLDRLNELEWINGEIFANVWQTDRVVRIDPATGRVRGVIDFTGLLPAAERAGTDVLNGLAYESETGRLLVTGKWWPRIYEVKVKEKVSGK
jgi:glutamine cyclotransferase